MIRVNPFYLLPDDAIPERLRSLDAYGRVEAALIGRLLLEPSLVPRAIRYGAREELFVVELFRRAWGALSSLHSKGIPCDMHSIRAELREVNPNDDTLLVEIACMFESPGYNANIKHYVRILRFRSARSLAEKVAGRKVTRVDARVHPNALVTAGKTNPQTALEGKFSVPFCISMGLRGYAVVDASGITKVVPGTIRWIGDGRHDANRERILPRL